MSEIINLNKVRKAKAKTEKRKKAVENRIIFGTSTKIRKAEIEKVAKESKKLDQRLLNTTDGNKKE
ncbi:DUF4169 family protein [Asticcacaulis machinosus]|uniref:DUF4169 family protein n=1 Tax=Asticcacaulis machinosus TaxID=2984211 RepID=A0ABT5HNY1_9CAUL|nr:DUF4169 family protein [Asticcacaulis machinosus]MDC7677319.1 DUF4169 family protein [Asticcacaulis machinosus]